jgi:hypothetical protein
LPRIHIADNVQPIAMSRHLAHLLVGAAIAAVVAFGLSRGLFVAAASDAYGYVSEADLWARGALVVHQPFAERMNWRNASASLAPLGYRPHTSNPADKDIVPIYSPGVPMIMAIFKLAFGARAVFYVVPLLGGLAVFATYLMGARLGGPLPGAAAAVLLAASPTFLFEAVAPASDVACTAWWALTLAVLTIERRSAAFGAGVACGLAILTRPNLVPAAAIPGAVLVWRAWREWSREAEPGVADRRDGPRALLFAAGSIPACVAVALINQRLYGSPTSSGYGPFSTLYSWSFFATNLSRYPRWILETETAIVLLALAAPFVLRRTGAVSRVRHPATVARMWLAFAAVTFLLYVFYLPFEEWWYLRFLMPAFPPMLALTCVVLWRVVAPLGRVFAAAPSVVASVIIAGVAWHGVSFSLQRGAQLQWVAEQRYATAGKFIAAYLPHRAAIICMQHSGGVRYYAHRITIRYDVIEPPDLDGVAAQLRQLGYVPYVVLDDAEEPPFRERFASHSRAGALDWSPLARFDGVSVFDLKGK